MYKDVKKKLLSVALCVCMVIGAVQVVPRAKAAAQPVGGYYPITVGIVGTAETQTVYVQLAQDTTYTYNRSAHTPEILNVVTNTANPQGTSIMSSFQTALNIVEGSSTDAGTFYGLLASKDNTYSVSDTPDNRIEFTIKPATVTDMDVVVDSNTLKYTDGGVQPSVSSVTLTIDDTYEQITYTGDDIENNFSVGKIDSVGRNQTSEITLKSNSNFKNTLSQTVNCTVAYDLGTYATLDSASIQYTGADLSSQIAINVFDKDGTKVKGAVNKNTLSSLRFVFKKEGSVVTEVSQAGTYTVEVTPSAGATKTVSIGTADSLYTGTFIGTFTVGLKSGTFKVQAYDNDAYEMRTLSGTGSYLYRISVNEKNSDGEILPRDLTVDIDDVRIYDYDLTFTDMTGKSVRPTKAGQYNMTITPKASTNYGGSITVQYYVYSELNVSTIQFRNVPGDNPVELSYNGTGYEIQNIVVKDTADNTLVQNTHFTIEYQYKSGDTWISVQTYSDPNMCSVGAKRILVVGKNAYRGETAEWQYNIAKVSMTDSAEAKNFELKWVNGASYSYKGSAVTPDYTFKYRNVEIDPSYYSVTWKNNTNAGAATLTVSATSNSPFIGSLSLGFTINALSLSDAECIGDGVNSDPSKYSYTGKPISPQLKINEYELKSSDYTVTKYQTQAGKDLGTIAPTEPGDYQMMIVSRNNNIKGSKTVDYSIIRRDISQDIGASFYLREGSPVEWQGGVTEPEVVCGSMEMLEGRDYTVRYEHNTAPTTTVSASAIVTGKGYFTGTKTLYFDISKRKISNANVAITPNVTGTAPNYAVTFSGRDEGTKVEKHALVENTDYKVTGIVYETASDYVPTISDLNHLQRAGVYIVTVEGLGNYEGTTEVPVTCGTDISNATISTAGGTLTYDGTEKVPTIRIKVGNQSQITYKSGVDAKFELEFSRNDSDNVPIGYENIYAGTVIVRAVGNTKNGYYGTTTNSVQYTIQPMDIAIPKTGYRVDLTDDPDKDSIDAKGYVHYKFTNKRITPLEEVVKTSTNTTTASAAAILERDIDYTISYGDDCIGKGPHTITVRGKGNFTGEIGTTFYIDALGINSDEIIAYFTSGATYADGVPELTLKLNGSVTLKDAALYTDADYQVNVTRKDSGVGWNDTYVYTITGLNNFAGTTRVETCTVTQTTLKRPTGDAAPQAKETYVSEWDYDELIVSPTTTVSTPSKFTLKYQRTDGTTYNLILGEDYNVKSFIPTKKSGKGSTMVIEGVGGFNGEVTYDVPLFTDITTAEFLKDSEGNEASVLRPGGTISVETLKEAISAGTLSQLVTFKSIWPDDIGGTVPTDCYTVTVPNGYTPKIGKLTLTVSGNHDNYYTGKMSFDVNVTGELTEELTTVEIGDNNAVPWKGVTVTPGAVKVQVKAGTKILTGGYVGVGETIPSNWDYTVTFSDNTGVGLATATITGVNTYSGTITRNFKITCALSELVVSLQKQDGSWEDYDGGSPEYVYQIDTERNKPAVKLFYKHADNSLSELATELYSLTYSGYQAAGNAKLVIGEPDNTTFKGILLGTSRAVNYTLAQISLDDVVIQLTNPQPVYTGNEMNATDIGLKLTYGSYTLTDADYTLIFRDAINADIVDGRAARVIINAKGNFSGMAEREFNIQPMPISSQTDINASAETLIYTGDAIAPKLTVNQVTGRIRALTEGTDYRIVQYLDQTKTALQDTPFVAIGTYYVRIEGLGNYASTINPYRDIQYEIVTREVTDGLTVTFVDSTACPVVNGVPTCIYNGNAHEPSIRVSYNDKILNGPNDTDPAYQLTYANNVNAGKATVTITGVGSFDGTRTVDFMIQPKDITGDDIDYLDKDGNAFQNDVSYDWTKATIHPELSIYDRSRNTDLVAGDDATSDYSIGYDDDNDDRNTQTNAGLVTMTITGQNNYTGTRQFTYYIGEDISKAYTLVNGRSSVSTTYNGLEQAPEESSITVEKGSSAIDLTDENGEKRYDIAYYKNGFEKSNLVTRDQIIDAATYYVAIVGVPSKGTYAKTSVQNSCAYTINPRSIAPSYILVSGYDGTYYYTGQPIEPKGITVEDTDLPVKNDPTDPQRRSVKLVNGTDFDISYTNNISAGKASIVVAGKGNYTGSRAAYFNIVSSDTSGNNTWDGTSEGTGSITDGTTTIAASDIILGYDNSTYNCMMYNGYERIPTVSINGASTSEFIITASNNVRPGVATLMITGRGNNYTGTIIKNYTIKANLSSYGTVGAIADQNYTGYQVTPYVTVTCGGNLLTQGHDYTLTYANNTNVGRATVIATATADSYYLGTATGYFNISNTATGMEITGYASSYTYTGNAITPDVIVTMNGRVLNRGTDYTVTYSNNTNVGTATMTVTGIGSFSGTKTINYVIEARNIENCITTAVNNYQYTGNTYTPAVTLTDASTGKALTAGTDYTITYSNNTNPGTASITVTALGRNYTGSKVISFKITSAAVSGLRVSKIKNNSMRLSWSDQDYADGYQICNANNRVIGTTTNNSYTVKKLTSCTTYRYKVRSYVENEDGSVSYGSFSTAVSAQTMLNTPTLKARSVSRGKVTLTWTKVAKASGYEIYYSTEKNGIYTKLKTVSKSSARKYVDAGLASGEKYFYTIRAYRTVNGVKTYSSYNTIKSATVK